VAVAAVQMLLAERLLLELLPLEVALAL